MPLRGKAPRLAVSCAIAVVTVCLGILAYFHGVAFLDLMELKTVDLRFKSRGPLPAGSQVVLAVIDEKSIAREGKWIWPRSKIAELVARLSAAGARVIAFDIGFLEADDRRVIQALGQVAAAGGRLLADSRELETFLQRLQAESDHDRRLAAAIADSRAQVVLGYFFQMEPPGPSDGDAEQKRRNLENIAGSRYSQVHSQAGRAGPQGLISAAAAQATIDEIAPAGRLSGYFNMLPDADGVVRWLPAVVHCGEDYYAPLALVAAGAYLDRPLALHLGPLGVETLTMGERVIPTDALGRFLINYRGGPKSFIHIPVTDILGGTVAGDLLRDRIVVVGATALGIFDYQVSPVASVFPGVEIHANAIDMLLAGDFLRQPSWAAAFDLAAMASMGFFLGLALPAVGVISGAIVALAALSGYLFFCQYLFTHQGWILNLVYPLSVAALVYVLVTAYQYRMESKQRRFIREVFATYLAPAVVEELIDSGQRLELGGEEREITAFFSDVQGFTSISERLSPRELVDLLNEFLTEMTDIILAHKGTVDKFEGDAIIAFFGAPAAQPDHAAAACRAAARMQRRLGGLPRHAGRTRGRGRAAARDRRQQPALPGADPVGGKDPGRAGPGSHPRSEGPEQTGPGRRGNRRPAPGAARRDSRLLTGGGDPAPPHRGSGRHRGTAPGRNRSPRRARASPARPRQPRCRRLPSGLTRASRER